ncbi:MULTISPECIES: aminobenzoate synthetase [unclassified Mycobacterium]|uniref:aminobenzoate synthetase n=1 Tax=unclassified Mycobacterium TaxID=2642494 RepID=UPI000560D684|nr:MULTISPECIES: aminobenzoate synthetase [unclassified Mycobacterium]
MVLDEIVSRLDEAATVLVDGRSGSGKSTLAMQLHDVWADSVVVRLDDIYPGWDGLFWAADHVHQSLLAPRAAGEAGRWRSWDWSGACPGDWHRVDRGQRLVIEGIGALTPATRALADLGIWVDADDATRKRRALRRDGDLYRPHWDRWAAQEEDFVARHRPKECADLIAVATPAGFEFIDPRRTS